MINFANFLHNYNPEVRKLIRKAENIEKKKINAELALIFNKTCYDENILPRYTNINTHDPAARYERFTVEYRYQLIERQIEIKKHQTTEYEDQRKQQYEIIRSKNTPEDFTTICIALKEKHDEHYYAEKRKILRKLNDLAGRSIFIRDNKDCFLNLSNYELSQAEKDVLNLGLNCHIQPKFDAISKRIEMEALYSSLLQLEDEHKIELNQNLKEELRAESTRRRSRQHSRLLSDENKLTMKNLKENENIIIRKADKSNMYVILNKSEYFDKIENILNDQSKFKKISADPTEKIKRKANKLIEQCNSTPGNCKLKKIIGDYEPGYFYGNVKTHKNNNPLRPIISQVPTCTYDISKQLNVLITPYIPSEYAIKSTDEFLDILHSTNCDGILASLDVTSLFTNVPIQDTIDIIIQNVYNHPTIPPLNIPQDILQKLLKICTSEAVFRAPNGNLFNQVDGIAMGSALGPTFAAFYMGNLEKIVLNEIQTKPKIYARYVDDIFLIVEDQSELTHLKSLMEQNSVLEFTFEMGVEKKIPFLDVHVTNMDSSFITKVYHKPTDDGWCMNGRSECPQRYRSSVIRGMIRRADTICSSKLLFDNELNHLKQRLINNGFTNTEFDKELQEYLRKKNRTLDNSDHGTTFKVYFQNQMSPSYKVDERVLKSIISRNVKCTLPENRLNVIIYYRNIKSSNMIMKNNLHASQNKLKSTNVIYEFKCPCEDCPLPPNSSYIGYTQCTLSRRLSNHLQNGAISSHFMDVHDKKISRTCIVENTSILRKINDFNRLAIGEALLIKLTKAQINRQDTGRTRTLKLFS